MTVIQSSTRIFTVGTNTVEISSLVQQSKIAYD